MWRSSNKAQALPWAFLLLVLGGAAGAFADPGDAARKIVERKSYQTEWPMTEAACRAGGDGGDGILESRGGTGRGGELCREGKARESREARERRQRRERQGAAPSSRSPAAGGFGTAAGALSQALLWMLGIVLVLMLAVFVANLLAQRRRDAAVTVTGGGDGDTDPAAPRPRPAEAERLAAEGHFGEAVHRLLLIAVDRLTRRQGKALEESLTSREVLRRLGLGEEARSALERLVLGTERFLFAEEAVDREEFEACRAAFERLGAVP